MALTDEVVPFLFYNKENIFQKGGEPFCDKNFTR